MPQLLQLAVALGGAIALLLIRLFLRRRSLLRHLPVPVSTLLPALARSLLGSSYLIRKASHASRPGFGATRRLFLRMKLVFCTLDGQTTSTSERLLKSGVHGSYATLLLLLCPFSSPDALFSVSRFLGHCRSRRSWPHFHKGLPLTLPTAASASASASA